MLKKVWGWLLIKLGIRKPESQIESELVFSVDNCGRVKRTK